MHPFNCFSYERILFRTSAVRRRKIQNSYCTMANALEKKLDMRLVKNLFVNLEQIVSNDLQSSAIPLKMHRLRTLRSPLHSLIAS